MENNKDITESDTSDKGTLSNRTSELPLNRGFNSSSHVVKKTDKLVTAIYMVTDFLDDSEPMKLILRTRSLNLFSKVRLFDTARSVDQGSYFEELAALLSEIISLLEIGSTVGLVSEMNGSILKKEFYSLLEIIRENHVLSSQSFFTPKALSHFLLKDDMFAVDRERMLGGYSQVQKDKSISHSLTETKGQEIKKTPTSKKTDIAVKIARRTDIINFVKDKKEATIKDIATVIAGCSEKTIQRLLSALVSEGVFKRTGDKRWSRYSLA